MSSRLSPSFISKPAVIELPPADSFIAIKVGKMVLLHNGQLPTLAQCRQWGVALSEQFICGAEYNGRQLYGATLPPNAATPDALQPVGLRGFLHTSTDDQRQAVIRAVELHYWQNEHRFCGKCGNPTALNTQDGSLCCQKCGFASFPIISPAIIVRISRNDSEILLAHNRNFPGAVYSNIAGFVESGETLEDAVRREVLEEVGVQATDIKYFASQNWPFPHSLLAAFTATYAGGDIKPDGEEIDDARWFDLNTERPPLLPEPGSISRALIDDFVEQTRP